MNKRSLTPGTTLLPTAARLIIATLVLTLAFTLAACSRQRTDRVEPKNILIIQEMDFREQSSIIIHEAFKKEFGGHSRYNITYARGGRSTYMRVHIKVPFHDLSTHIIESLVQIKQKPDLIILLSDIMAHSGASCDHPWMKEVPVLCLDVIYPEWEGRLASRPNFAVMQAKPEPKKNIDFIRDMGGPPWIVTVLDSTNTDDKLRQTILEQMGDDKEHYITNLNYETYKWAVSYQYRDPRTTIIPLNLEHTDFNGLDTIHNAHFKLPGMLRIANNHLTFLRLKDDVFIDRALGYNIGAYYSQTPKYFNVEYLSSLNSCIGGYMTPWPEVAKQAHPLIDRLLAGEDPADIPWQTLQKDYWLDWRIAKSIHPYAEDFPPYVRFVNLPWESQSRLHDWLHRHWLTLLLAGMALVTLATPIVLYLRSRKMHRALLDESRRAENNRGHIEKIMAASNSYIWEMTPRQEFIIGKEFARMAGTTKTLIPFEEMLSFFKEGREDFRKAITDPECGSTSVNIVVEIPNMGTHAYVIFINRTQNLDGTMHCNGFSVLNDEAHEVAELRRKAFLLSEEAYIKESFLAAMSHEIRNPLNAIIGFADILSTQHNMLTEEERTTYGNYLDESMTQLLDLLNTIMNDTNVKGKEFTLKLSKYNITEVMNFIYQTHKVIVPGNLRFNYKRGPQTTILANRTAILQIVSNLMNNAIKFTPRGSITLGWETIHDEEGDLTEIYVEDTGIGISPEDKQHIFTKHYKTDNHTVGAGIGLTLCIDLARSMNAAIGVESTLGKGSRFHLRIRQIS